VSAKKRLARKHGKYTASIKSRRDDDDDDAFAILCSEGGVDTTPFKR